MAGEVRPGTACDAQPRLVREALSPEDETALADLWIEQQRFPANRTLYQCCAESDSIYALLEGWAFRFQILPDGRRYIFSFLLPGDLVTLPLLFFDRTHASVQTLTKATLCRFDRHALEAFVAERPALLQQLARICVRELEQAEERTLDIARRPAKERLAMRLLELYVRQRDRGAASEGKARLPLRQQHWADALGLTPIHVSRVFTGLKDDGIVERRGTVYLIRDYPGLLEAAATDEATLKCIYSSG